MGISRRSLIYRGAALSTATIFAGTRVFAQTKEIYAEGGVAVDGSDVVAYFTEGTPTEGRPEHTHVWKGVEWRFSSAANKDAFVANPVAYAPQYGGYCAWAVSQGYTASTTPSAWKIVDGKLYLNFSRRIQRRWERDIPGHITSADANWPGVLN